MGKDQRAEQLPATLRYEVGKHVIEFVQVEEYEYSARLDGVPCPITVRYKVRSSYHDPEEVSESIVDAVYLGTLFECLRAGPTIHRNPIWIELSTTTRSVAIWANDDKKSIGMLITEAPSGPMYPGW